MIDPPLLEELYAPDTVRQMYLGRGFCLYNVNRGEVNQVGIRTTSCAKAPP